jgi:hypothetical protein
MKHHVADLALSPLHRFADWPNSSIPRVCAGVYAVYDREERFLYVGMAGAGLNKRVISQKMNAGKDSGLYVRLCSHANGYRSGDRFNIYIGDLYVLGTLPRPTIANISEGKASFDTCIKKYIRSELSYRYVVVPNNVVRGLEAYIQTTGINGRLPSINGRS